MDCGFYSIDVVCLSRERKLKFVIGAQKAPSIKRMLERLSKDRCIHMVYYRVKNNVGVEEISLFARWISQKEMCFTVIVWGVSIEEVNLYSRRWGVETEFRMLKSHRIQTMTINPVIMYFFVVVSMLICCFYAALRLGEVPEILEGVIILSGGVPIALYRVRRSLRIII